MNKRLPQFGPGRWASWLLAVSVILAPAAVLVWLRLGTSESIASIESDTTAVLVSGTTRTVADERPVSGAPTWLDGRSLRAPQWTGTVTGLHVAAGDTVTTGSRLLVISGLDRLAVASPAPFYRQLRAGDTGPDVAELKRALLLLGDLNAASATGDRFDAATAQAVRSLEASIGVLQPTGQFDPGWFVWLPVTSFTVGGFKLEVGEPAPPAGVAFATEAPTLQRVALTSVNANEPLTLDPGTKWVFVVGQARFDIDPATLEVSADSLAALASTAKAKTERIDGRVERAMPLAVVALPATAITVGPRANLCVWLPSGAGGRYEPREVTLAGSRAGVANVATGLDATTTVLANPSDVLASTACP
ncbi:MAG: hypothetical protein HYX53_10695 [Chloroflexi bacterium]|nr:hypothetical protein [Chloroflexota bacterium]